MKRTILVLSLLYTFTAYSQSDKNAMYVEVLGNARKYSINYERKLIDSRIVDLHSRIGLAAFARVGSLVVPTELNVTFGQKHMVETGLGATGHVNYRRQSYDRGF